MIDLSKYICELLHSHECVAVPGLGGFIIRKKNAVVYMAQNLFAPPSKHLHFNAQLTHNDGLLAHHISKESGISYETALESINEAVSDILYQLYKGQSVVFNDLGTISNLNGFLKFEPDAEQNIQDENYGLNSFIMHALQPDRRRNRPIIIHKERTTSQWKPIRSYQIAAVIAFLLLSLGGYFLQTEPVQSYMKGSLCPQIFSMVAPPSPPAPFASGIFPEEEQEKENDLLEGDVVGNEMAEMDAVTPEEIASETVSETAFETPSETVSPPVATYVSENNFMQTPVSGQYYIIIGAFQQSELAEKLCQRMRDNGYNTVTILDIPSGGLRKVALQSFDNLTAAREALRDVKQLQEDAWVLKWKN